MVDSKDEKNKKIYPSVSLPLSVLGDKNIDLDEEVTITLKGKVTRVEKSKWAKDFSFEAKEGKLV